MRRQRPTTILVFAILHILGSAAGLFGVCYFLTIMAVASLSSAPAVEPIPSPPAVPPNNAPWPMTQPTVLSSSQIIKYYSDHVPGYKAFTFAAMGVSFALDLMLLSSGIGLLKMRPWARSLSLVYAPLSILTHIVTFAYQLILLMPAMHDLFAGMNGPIPMGTIIEIITIASLVGGLLVVIYPIIVFVFMLRPSTKAAFRGELPMRDEEIVEVVEEAEDDPWREPPRSDKFRR